MSNWFTDKVNHLVREVRETQKAAAGRNADEVASELESQARRVSSPQLATELVSRWVERSDSGHGAFTLGGGREVSGDHGLAEPLSFYQALLRSQALELLLESCAKAPALRADLLKGGPSDMESPVSALGKALQSLVERLLLPGALALWPTLLEALMASEELDRTSKVGSCRSWAKRALNLVKRQWKYELIPSTLRCLDRKLSTLSTAVPPPEESSELLRSKEGMSKGGIRAALAKSKLKSAEAEAAQLRARAELLCDACARLEVAQSSGSSELTEVERLLEAADAMLHMLDAGVKELSAEQEGLRSSLTELKDGLEKQMSEFKETLTSFSAKRAVLEEERATLALRLEEVQMQLSQLQEASATYERRSKDLENQLRDTTKHFEEKIAGSFCQQRRLADEKLRAVACKACAHTAKDLVADEERRRCEELSSQLRRRRSDLRRTFGSYVRKERLRLEAIGGLDDAAAKVEKAWQELQDLLQRALPLCKAEQVHEKPKEEHAAPPVEELLSEPLPEDAASFFAKDSAGQGCIDCGLPDADWASVSCGAYLCVDCAGRHRGLGVHLSFVRSTTMDLWTPQQLRRMQLGGTGRLRSFLQSYPKLKEEPQTSQALFTRYSSRAMAYYRQMLELRSEGKSTAGLAPPSSSEGHLAAAGGPSEKEDKEDDEETALGSVEEELAQLEATYERLRQPDAAKSQQKDARSSS
ncbi:unnamed protein product [Effrenium voratum]|uniref:Arf-GAP domain-containing protein n=1 Tax=Effrenium voratum TaxID=2562239 RepID=A0AA36NKR1_9DINO|nr:unnamed protein product [Effrenium voratum]CAJ1420456.1 unnamed protein product [Effrenium voratum]